MSKVLSYVAVQFSLVATITSGTQQSSAVDLLNNTLCGIDLPTMTGTTLTFQTATSAAGTYKDMIDGAGNTLSKTIASGKYLYLDPNIFAGVRFLKITSGSSEGADRSLTLAVRAIT